MDIYYVDGEFVEEDKAMVPAKDITVLRDTGCLIFLSPTTAAPFTWTPT